MSETTSAASVSRRAHVIVVGNEKGGSGKTTTTMHLMIALLRLGFSVGSIDLDSRQRSLTRYIENRRQTVAQKGVALPVPQHCVIQRSPFDSMEEAKNDERERFARGLAKIYGSCDFVVIDTPGNDTFLSRLAHSFANTVITPINDSFVDLDVLAAVDGATLSIIKPSIYSEMVWEQKLQRAKRDGGSIDWIVMRNRLSNLDAKNKRFMSKVTEELARRIGFRVAPGFSERVIFREMFLQGLTVLDVLEMEEGNALSISHVAARQEVRNLLAVLRIPEIDRQIEKLRQAELASAAKASGDLSKPGDSGLPKAPPPAGEAPYSPAGEQKLPEGALDQAKTEMAKVKSQWLPAAAPEAPAAPGTAARPAASLVYPVRPTPTFASGQVETRGVAESTPALGDALPKDLPEAVKLPAWQDDLAIDTELKPAPAVPGLPPQLETLRPLPSLPSPEKSGAPEAASPFSAARTAGGDGLPFREKIANGVLV